MIIYFICMYILGCFGYYMIEGSVFRGGKFIIIIIKISLSDCRNALAVGSFVGILRLDQYCAYCS